MNLETLYQYYDNGLLTKQVHPTLPLTIWNYTPKVQYEGLWDEITIQCRGIVTDIDGNIVARPFRKFYNIEENRHIPTEKFDVYEKMDGSLGILFYYDGQWILATRGSFTSDQANKGREMLQKYEYTQLHKSYTYLFEIIYDENQIVCKYDFEDLILLGMVETETSYEVNLYDEGVDIRHKNLIKNIGLNVVKRYDGILDYTTLKRLIPNNSEGYVIRFSNGDRMKIKGEEYLRLHKIMSNLSTTAIWEVLSSGGTMDEILNNVPDEFYVKIKEYEDKLKYEYQTLYSYSKFIFDILISSVGYESRAVFAYEAKKYKYPSILFNMLDGKEVDDLIWKIIKPKFQKL